MLYLHQIHRLDAGDGPQFEEFVRDRWLPAVNEVAGVRFAWYATSTPIARWSDEAITILAVSNAAALEGLLASTKQGALADLVTELAEHRTEVTTRILRPLDYDPWTRARPEIPDVPQDGEPVAYMHDFVPPAIGQMGAYIDMMREKYMALTDKDLSGVVLRASWQTVSGGGPVPEMFNLSAIRDVDALVQLIAHEIPREFKAMGTWMWEALATRDQWTTRLVRSARWSPMK